MLVFVHYVFPLKKFSKVIPFYPFIIYRITILAYDNIVFHCARDSGMKWGVGETNYLLRDC